MDYGNAKKAIKHIHGHNPAHPDSWTFGSVIQHAKNYYALASNLVTNAGLGYKMGGPVGAIAAAAGTASGYVFN